MPDLRKRPRWASTGAVLGRLDLRGSEQRVQLLPRVVVRRGQQVPVLVRHVRRAVPDKVADRLERRASREHETDVGVPTLVQRDRLEEWELSLLADVVLVLPRLRGVPTESVRDERIDLRTTEDEIVTASPSGE